MGWNRIECAPDGSFVVWRFSLHQFPIIKQSSAMNSRFPLRILFVALLPVALVLQGCDSGGSSAEVNNEFSLTIEPTSSSATAPEAVSRPTLDGFSFFVDAENPETGEQAFGVYLSDNQSFSQSSATQGLFGFIARSSGRPGPGEYDFASGGSLQSSQFVGFLYEDFTNFQSAPFYVIEDGTLNLEESSGSKVSGTINATGTMYVFSGSETSQESVTITGNFTAKDVDTFVDFSTPGV